MNDKDDVMKPFKLIVLMSTSCLMLAGAAAQAQGHGGPHRGDHGERGGNPAMRSAMMLRAADANGDNSITRAEVDALQGDMFAWMDRNGDGYLDEADQSPIRQRLRAAREAEAEDGDDRERRGRRGMRGRGGRGGEGPGRQFDADEDGRISRAEFLDGENRLFGMLDTDEDGVITPDELDAASERRQERREDRRRWWRN
ncbi:MAG: hypothetical protein CMF73_15480 [Maricaulis sp.]|nr:hypothetical protein [Maricaulis sp.]